MERVALTAFICKITRRLSSSYVQELNTSVLRALDFGGKHQIYTNGKKKEKKKNITDNTPSHLGFDQEQTATSLQSLANATAQYVENHIQAQTCTNPSGNEVCTE